MKNLWILVALLALLLIPSARAGEFEPFIGIDVGYVEPRDVQSGSRTIEFSSGGMASLTVGSLFSPNGQQAIGVEIEGGTRFYDQSGGAPGEFSALNLGVNVFFVGYHDREISPYVGLGGGVEWADYEEVGLTRDQGAGPYLQGMAGVLLGDGPVVIDLGVRYLWAEHNLGRGVNTQDLMFTAGHQGLCAWAEQSRRIEIVPHPLEPVSPWMEYLLAALPYAVVLGPGAYPVLERAIMMASISHVIDTRKAGLRGELPRKRGSFFSTRSAALYVA